MSTVLTARANYWQATRAFSAPASIVPVVVGSTAAVYFNGRSAFNVGVFFVTLIGALLAHFGANVINDYFDYVNGVDTAPEHGSGVITGGLLTKNQMLKFGMVLLAGAGVCGLIVYSRAPHGVLTLALIGLACAVLYPALLKRFALGDFLIITAFGVGITLGSYIVQTGDVNWQAIGHIIIISLPVASLVDAILHANNLRDVEADRVSGVTTLATLLSPNGGKALFAALMFFPLAFVVIAPLLGIVPISCAVALIAFKPILDAYRTGNVPQTAQSHLAFGLPYALAFLVRPFFGH